jgi:hypothetical protein
MKKWTKILAITLTLALLGSAIGAALVMAADSKTATPPAVAPNPPAANPYDALLLDKLVSKLNLTLDNLKAAYKAARLEVLAQQVTDGKLTQAQADEIKARWEKETDVRVSFSMGMLGMGPGPRGAAPKSGATATPPVNPAVPAANTYDTLLINKIVAKLNVTLDKFKAAYQAARLEVLAQQVTDGKLTQTQANEIKTIWEKAGDNGLFAPIGFGRMAPPAGVFDPAANEQQFLEKLTSRLGTTVDKLKEAYKATRLELLTQQVTDGKLTQAQADEIKANWDKETDVRTGLNLNIGPRGPGGHGGPGGGPPPVVK